MRKLVTRYSIAIDGKDIEALLDLCDPELDNERYGRGRDRVRA
jgi:hypothetical protein